MAQVFYQSQSEAGKAKQMQSWINFLHLIENSSEFKMIDNAYLDMDLGDQSFLLQRCATQNTPIKKASARKLPVTSPAMVSGQMSESVTE